MINLSLYPKEITPSEGVKGKLLVLKDLRHHCLTMRILIENRKLYFYCKDRPKSLIHKGLRQQKYFSAIFLLRINCHSVKTAILPEESPPLTPGC